MSIVKTASAESVEISPRTTLVAKLVDYVELTKPRIAVLSLFTVTIGYILGCEGVWQLAPLLHALLGITFVAAGSSALNQYLERSTDARMNRTSNRPLPGGRLLPAEVLVFGFAAGLLGCLYLAATVNLLTAILAASTLLIYAFVYTPLKKLTPMCTAVGAVAGALPPVLGWTAANGELTSGSLVLFAILFLWQFPHFLAIGWLYHDDYLRAGLKMLPTENPAPRIIGCMCVVHALVLLPVSLLPSRIALAGNGYFLAALVLGLGYLLCAALFMLNESKRSARRLILSSVVYLPLLLLLLTWDHFQLLR